MTTALVALVVLMVVLVAHVRGTFGQTTIYVPQRREVKRSVTWVRVNGQVSGRI